MYAGSESTHLMVTFDAEKRPGISNLLSIHSFVTGKSIDTICKEAEHLDTGRFKLEVADAVVAYVKPIQDTIAQHLSDKSYLLNVLAQGAEKASNIANDTLKEVHEKLGMVVKSADKAHVSIKNNLDLYDASQYNILTPRHQK
ncbi:hypothetical protein HUJ05_003580, partial [Dendroctonus ponderosae]